MQTISDVSTWSPGLRAIAPPAECPPIVLLAVDDPDAKPYALHTFTRVIARSTSEVLTLLARERPAVAVIDVDVPSLEGAALCAAAKPYGTVVLVTMTSPQSAPALLKAGCHAVLLKPFSLNLVAARIGRLMRAREQAQRLRTGGTIGDQEESGTNRVWEDVACPKCQAPSATSFEFSSHRRMWFACLRCAQVWIGARQE